MQQLYSLLYNNGSDQEGTSIYSDMWAAYNNLDQIGYGHGTVKTIPYILLT